MNTKEPQNGEKEFLTTVVGQWKDETYRTFAGQTQSIVGDRFKTFLDGYRLDYLKIDIEITHLTEIDALIDFLRITRHCFTYDGNLASPRNPTAGVEYKEPERNFLTKKP